MFAPPTAVILGIVGLCRDESKRFAIAAVVIGAGTCSLWLLPLFFG